MSDDIEVKRSTLYEFPYGGFSIVFDDGVWSVVFEDPELDTIILEDSEGIYFDKEIRILNIDFSMEDFIDLKNIIGEYR